MKWNLPERLRVSLSHRQALVAPCANLHWRNWVLCSFTTFDICMQVFGLPGMLSTLNQTLDHDVQQKKQIDIYGPKGLRTLLRANLRLTKSDIAFKFAIHELVPIDEQYPAKWDVSRFRFTNLDVNKRIIHSLFLAVIP